MQGGSAILRAGLSCFAPSRGEAESRPYRTPKEGCTSSKIAASHGTTSGTVAAATPPGTQTSSPPPKGGSKPSRSPSTVGTAEASDCASAAESRRESTYEPANHIGSSATSSVRACCVGVTGLENGLNAIVAAGTTLDSVHRRPEVSGITAWLGHFRHRCARTRDTWNPPVSGLMTGRWRCPTSAQSSVGRHHAPDARGSTALAPHPGECLLECSAPCARVSEYLRDTPIHRRLGLVLVT